MSLEVEPRLTTRPLLGPHRKSRRSWAQWTILILAVGCNGGTCSRGRSESTTDSKQAASATSSLPSRSGHMEDKTSADAPVLPELPPAERAMQVSVGQFHACAVLSGGGVRCIGHDTNGQTRVPKDLAPVERVSAGWFHTCAVLRGSGHVKCWGSDWAGQSTPPSSLDVAIDVVASRFHSCALTKRGRIVCWGEDGNGELPAKDGEGIVEMSTGMRHVCGMNDKGSVQCWGSRAKRQLAVPPDATATHLDAGHDVACLVRKKGGGIDCWGAASLSWAPGRRATDGGDSASGAARVSVNEAWQVYAVLHDGSVRAWDPEDRHRREGVLKLPRHLENGTAPVADVDVGTYAACALRRDGYVECWGEAADAEGELLVDASWKWPWRQTSGQVVSPADSSPSDGQHQRAMAVAAGQFQSCGLLTDGHPRCWTGAEHEQGVARSAYEPNDKLVAQSITAGGDTVCAIQRNGSQSFCWDYAGKPAAIENHTAQISTNGSWICTRTIDMKGQCEGPLGSWKPARTSQVVDVHSGLVQCAVFRDGSYECSQSEKHPVRAPEDLGPIRRIVTNSVGACAIRRDESLRCWSNSDLSEDLSAVPEASQVRALLAGNYHICALTRQGRLHCWGPNDGKGLVDYGQAVVPAGLGSVHDVALGAMHTCALLRTGRIACWGDNRYGQLRVPDSLMARGLPSPPTIPRRFAPRDD